MKQKSKDRPVRVGLISLGCAKNLVDAEIMLGSLLKDGVEITNDAAEADVVIVNTCSFIDSAQEESVDTILESAELREAKNRGQGLIVSGCLPQRFREELPKLLPEVDAFMGIDQVAQVTDIVRQAMARRSGKNAEKHRTSNIEHPTSKSKIVGRIARAGTGTQTGCGRRTESLRGPEKFGKTKTVLSDRQSPIANRQSLRRRHRPPHLHPRLRHAAVPAHAAPFRLREDRRRLQSSVQLLHHSANARIAPQPPQPDIVAEAQALIADGVKELNLISQDSTYYGLDLRRSLCRRPPQPRHFVAGEVFRGRAAHCPRTPRRFARCCAN